MTNPPTIISNSSMLANQGSASIADAAGNLLFYTDGIRIWNKLNTTMSNGTGLLGGGGYQNVLIAKLPGSNSIYYVFTASSSGLYYSIVDMSLSSGSGSVTVKNVNVTTIPQANKVTGTKHCNQTDFWIVSQDDNSNLTRVYLLTSAGLNTSALLTGAGPINTAPGELKFSPNGNKFVSSTSTGTLEIYDFNIATGFITGFSQITPIAEAPRAIEFSADGTKLYAIGFSYPYVLQWDLCAGSGTAITTSQYTVSTGGALKEDIQLGPDGKIYLTRYGNSDLAVINNPNVYGAGCNFVEIGQSLGSAISRHCLPNFIKSFSTAVPFTYTVSLTSCQTVSFSASQTGNFSCTTYSTINSWNFGDPGSGSSNVSSLPNPVHTYPGPGTYTSQLISNYTCGSDTIIQLVTISNASPLTITGNLNLCPGHTTTLVAHGANSYSWNAPGGGTINDSTIIITPTISGTSIYTVISGIPNGCASIQTATITAYPSPTLTITGNRFVCPGLSTSLTANGASSYVWSTGAQTNSLVLNPPSNTTYSVTGTGTNGCESTAIASITVQPFPIVSLNSPTSCINNTVTLLANTLPASGITFTWLAGGANSSSITVSPASTSVYSVIADLNGCSVIGSSTVTIQELVTPVIDFHYAAPICNNAENPSPIPASNFNSGGNYFSMPGLSVDTTSGIIDLANSISGNYTVSYSLQQVNCTAAGSSTTGVSIVGSPTLQIKTRVFIAPGSTTTLSVSGGVTYTWTPDSGLSCSDCSNPIVSPPESKQYCVLSEENGCISKACVLVDVTCDANHDFSVPNAFTPNGDNTNEQFCLQGWDFCVKDFSVLIFNRWGEKVFESADPNFCWDGTYKARPLNSEVFAYVINAIYSDSKRISKKGNITLIR